MHVKRSLLHFLGPVPGVLACLLTAPAALASAPPQPVASPQGSAAEPAPPSRRMRKYAPTDGQVELGIYLGVMLPPIYNHSLYESQWRPLRPVFASLGGRLGFYPLRWIGVEIEGGALPGSTQDGKRFAAYTIRGHAILQLPYRLAPFILAGGGALAIRTPKAVLGTDLDPVAYIGTGLKFYVEKQIALRLEWRGSFAQNRLADAGTPAMFNELLLGVSFVFGRKPRPD